MTISRVIDPLSVSSLKVELYYNTECLGSATGFPVKYDGEYFLITNWHVVTGRNPANNVPSNPNGLTPNILRIYHHAKTLGNWVAIDEPLYLNGNKRWKEHSTGNNVDVVALPLSKTDSNIITIYDFDIKLADIDMIAQPAMPVSIIGYPFGFSMEGLWPIWKTGHIATDPDLNLEKTKPAFLIDATTRGGMSGSPVVLRLNGGYRTSSGNQVIAGGVTTKFLGVYSGRIHSDVEIGIVWKPIVIKEIMES